METVLDAEQPDLVVLNGDLITGENTFRENSTAYLDQIVAPMIQRTVPWASTYGNHDSALNLSRAALLAREQQQRPLGLARTTNMLPDISPSAQSAGVTNYYLPVYASNCPLDADADTEADTEASSSHTTAAAAADRCVPVLILWFFDSRGGFAYRQTADDAATGTAHAIGQENWVDVRVVAWFESTQAALLARYGVAIPSLAFVHIPPNVAYALQMEDSRNGGSTPGGIDPHRHPGINDDKPLAQQAQGWCADGTDGGECAYGGQDEPFMRAIAASGNGTGVIALFSGHDHGDTWCRTWEAGRALHNTSIPGTGVHICFGQHSGYGGYGTWTRGARLVRVTEASLQQAAAAAAAAAAATRIEDAGHRRPVVETWVRLESGDIVGHVSLNTTYGRDVYPATPNTHTHCPTCDSSAGSASGLGGAQRLAQLQAQELQKPQRSWKQ